MCQRVQSGRLCRKFKYFPVPADSALKILTQAGYLEYTDEQDNASRLYFTVRRDELYKLRELGEDMDKLIQIVLRSTPEYSRITPLSTRIHLQYVAD